MDFLGQWKPQFVSFKLFEHDTSIYFEFQLVQRTFQLPAREFWISMKYFEWQSDYHQRFYFMQFIITRLCQCVYAYTVTSIQLYRSGCIDPVISMQLYRCGCLHGVMSMWSSWLDYVDMVTSYCHVFPVFWWRKARATFIIVERLSFKYVQRKSTFLGDWGLRWC